MNLVKVSSLAFQKMPNVMEILYRVKAWRDHQLKPNYANGLFEHWDSTSITKNRIEPRFSLLINKVFRPPIPLI